MITLTAALQVAANSLRANSAGLGIAGQNLANQGTPGYARQIVQTQGDGFDPFQSRSGGAHITTQDTRSQFMEQAVWFQQAQSGGYQSFMQSAGSVSQVLGLNDVTGSTGIQNSLNKLFQSFSSWAASPQATSAQNSTISAAQALATDVSSAAQAIQQTVTGAQSQAQNVVTQINSLVAQIQQWNQQVNTGATPDAMAQAQVYSALETLSNLAPITTLKNSDGTMSILMNGTTPLLTGGQQYSLQSNLVAPPTGSTYPQGNPTLQILDGQGHDITNSFTGGQLGGLVNYINTFAPSLIGNGNQQGALNQLAQGVADAVNTTLGGAKPMFQYGAGSPTQIAASLQVNSSLTSADLANALTANPNAASNLSSIVSGTTPATQINGLSFTDFLNSMASTAASAMNTQQAGLTLHTQLLQQAQSDRTLAQGVSLETEAVSMIQYQQAFEAASKVISVIDTLTQTAINMVSP